MQNMEHTLSITGDFPTAFTLPVPAMSFEQFREWTQSDDFPEKGRIDYVAGRVEIDMSPEKLFGHGQPKSQLARAMMNRVDDDDLGYVFLDCTRIATPEVSLSAEPDIVFVSHESLNSGRCGETPSKSDPDDSIELVGAPDLVVEVVSDSSVRRDTKLLMKAYYDAGIDEYWIADARGDEVVFDIYARGAGGFEAVPTSGEGFVGSRVLRCEFRLSRSRNQHGRWKFTVDRRPLG